VILKTEQKKREILFQISRSFYFFKKSDDAKETADEVGEEEKVTEDKQAENEKEETKDE
jgi:hypothetical protein